MEVVHYQRYQVSSRTVKVTIVSLKPFCADYGSLEMVLIFSPDTHSPDNISRFTSYLKLLLLPEVKYGERFLPVGEKKLRVWQPSAH